MVLAILSLLLLGVLWVSFRRARQDFHDEHHALVEAIADRDTRVEETRSRTVGIITRRLRESDPGFEAEGFIRRVRAAFPLVQDARSSGKLSSMRPFVSDGIHERLALEMEDRRRRGRPPRPRQALATRFHLANVATSSVFDELTVGIETPDGGEFWTFLRRHGAATRAAPGLLERRCPNCGSDIEFVETARCDACQAFLRSGEHDWVLVEIVQPDAWTVRAPHRIPGVSAVLASDPAFSPQHLEDRIGVVFWRMLLAERERSGATRLAAIADASFCERFERAQKEIERPPELVLAAEIELRSVDLRRVCEQDGWHRVLATVLWEAVARRSGDASKEASDPLRGSRLFVLARRVSADSRIDHAVSSAHCPSCGAPESGRGSTACAYCGAVLNDGRTDWILVDCAETHTVRGHALLREHLSPAELKPRDVELARFPEAAVRWIPRVLTAEGPFDAEQSQRFRELMAELDLQTANRSIVRAHETAEDPRLGRRAARKALPLLIDLALSLGRMGDNAKTVLLELAEPAQLTSIDIRNLIDRREREWDGRAERSRREREDEEAQLRRRLERRTTMAPDAWND